MVPPPTGNHGEHFVLPVSLKMQLFIKHGLGLGLYPESRLHLS